MGSRRGERALSDDASAEFFRGPPPPKTRGAHLQAFSFGKTSSINKPTPEMIHYNKCWSGWLAALDSLAWTLPQAFGATYDGVYFETKGKGPALVFIHGGQMDGRMWDAQFEVFARNY